MNFEPYLAGWQVLIENLSLREKLALMPESLLTVIILKETYSWWRLCSKHVSEQDLHGAT